jgi:hypothetical protein
MGEKPKKKGNGKEDEIAKQMRKLNELKEQKETLKKKQISTDLDSKDHAKQKKQIKKDLKKAPKKAKKLEANKADEEEMKEE